MALVTKTFTFSAGAVIVASQHNTNFDTLYNLVNGTLNTANLDPSAAVAATQLNLATIAQTMSMSSAAINFAKGSDIASATTTDIGGMTGNYGDVTGTTTITGLGTVQAGTFRIVRFTGALTLTHNGTSLLLPTAANITTVANDVAGFVSLGSGNWKCVWYQRYDGTALVSATASTALSGSVIQVVNTQTGAVATGTTTLPNDDTIPQNTEGDEYMTLAITPNNSSNTLLIIATVNLTTSNGGQGTVALFQDSTANALACTLDYFENAIPHSIQLRHKMAAGTTSSTTFKIRAGQENAATNTFNGIAGGRKYGGVLASSITIQEIKA